MDGKEFYESFTATVREHGMRGVVFGPGEIPSWDELRERSQLVWSEIAQTIERSSESIGQRIRMAR